MFENASVDAPLDAGIYTGTVVAIDMETVDFGDGPEDKARWSWLIEGELDDKGKPITVSGLTGLQYGHEKANLTKWSKALGWTKEEHPAQSDLIGRSAMLSLSVNDRGYLRIDNVAPAKAKRGK